MIKFLLIVYFHGTKNYQSIFLFLNSVSYIQYAMLYIYIIYIYIYTYIYIYIYIYIFIYIVKTKNNHRTGKCVPCNSARCFFCQQQSVLNKRFKPTNGSKSTTESIAKAGSLFIYQNAISEHSIRQEIRNTIQDQAQ